MVPKIYHEFVAGRRLRSGRIIRGIFFKYPRFFG